ncbi:NAD(P)/FAD-dependent oxidoreductase [Candidatus Entotheonella palauensis]|uniref:N-methyl-L-tryptophan oxidase n=1 Tax=Candidatus Entotheonella gemina TaxID=1429439 RepID=W4M599_9BACT|nr:FAD-dependent oxidoreductase [Candidatus Entotheonella palauensis]ETX05375.1 MAG: N-methyl-L-tryptophan oxidase [Candidatus Entotheonella gemina]
MTTTSYDYLVIGKGLMGAAAARHLATESQSVAVLGPDEPADRASHPGIFGSHYDEGRITRILDPDPIWARLAQRSLGRYREIETQSGIPFYHEVGHLMVGPEPGAETDFMACVQHVAKDLNVACDTLADAAIAEQFPNLAFESGSMAMYQPHTAGHVSPRSQVRAQVAAAQKQGVTVIPEIVQRVEPKTSVVTVTTSTGQVIHGQHVLVATGGFSNTQALLPKPLEIDVYARTIVLLELGPDDVSRLQGMPSIIYKPRDPAGHCYILPPIRYPDGKYYLKIGGYPQEHTLGSLETLQDWFRGKGSVEAARHLAAKLHRVVPGLRPVAVHSDSCVTTSTPTGQIYADRIGDGRVGVLVGGNGSAGKSADEIGRVGALMMAHEKWVYDIEAHHFRARFAVAF